MSKMVPSISVMFVNLLLNIAESGLIVVVTCLDCLVDYALPPILTAVSCIPIFLEGGSKHIWSAYSNEIIAYLFCYS